jgi:ceramide glucosyltransferase
MTILLWLIAANLSLVASLFLLASTLNVRRSYRPIDSDVPQERPPVSVLVPLEGAAPGLADRLERLVAATRDGDQVLLAMEWESDPAHTVCRELRRAHPDRDVEVVLAGPAGERMGKQHNLAAAWPRVAHQLVAVMDDDAVLTGANLDEGARLAGRRNAGAAFAIPYYAGAGPLGGAVVAAYTNYGFSLNMGSIALRGTPRFIVGCFWVASRSALSAIGGFEPFTRTVSDDAAIGRAMRKAGLHNRPMRRPVRLALEQLSLAAGVRRVVERLTLLRAEGLGLYLTIAVAWHPPALAALAFLVGVASPLVPTAVATGVLVAAVASRAASVLLLNRAVYSALARSRFLLTTLLYDLFVAPVALAVAAGRRHVEWRGRRYRIGAGGTIR